MANHDIFYELAERSPLLTPYTGQNPVVLSCIATMRKEVDMSTALALDSSPSTAAAHFFRALGRVKCGHITGALADLRTCKNKLGSDSRAGSCANQEFYYVERLLTRQCRYCDAAAVAAAAETCAAREARGAVLAKEALAQDSAVRRQWHIRTRILHEQRVVAALQQPNAPEESTDIPTVLRINTQAKSCEDPSPVQNPRSVASWPVSSAPSSPPDSPRQAEVAPAQQCLTPGDARAEAALQQWEEFCAMLCQQRKAMSALATAADKNLTLSSPHKDTTSDIPVSPRSAASWPASSAASSLPDSPRQAEVAPCEPTTTLADARALAALQQWKEFPALLCQQRADATALAALQQWEQYSATVCRQRAAAAADNACNPPSSTRQALTCCGPHPTSSFPIPCHWALEGAETDVPTDTAPSSPSDSPRHADAAPAQPSASSAPEQPAAAPAEHGSAAEAEAPPSPVCLCMHEDSATKVLTLLERYRHAEAEVYLRQLKISQPHTGKDVLQPSSHEQSALSLGNAGANQDGCGATSAAASSCAPAEAAYKKEGEEEGQEEEGPLPQGLSLCS
ncbi:g5616 [Coccomyxa elongata]